MKNLHNAGLLLLLCFFAVTTSVSAQKPNTKTLTVKYVQPPLKPLPPNVKTYMFLQQKLVSDLNLSENNKRTLLLQGYERVSISTEADLMFKITITDMKYDGEVEKVTYKKKINDSTYVEKQGGAFIVRVGLRMKLEARDLKNDKVLEQEKTYTIHKEYKSQTFDTYDIAVKAFSKERKGRAMELANELIADQRATFQSRLNSNYGYVKKSTYLQIARGKGRKHDYSDLENAWEQFSVVVDSINRSGLNEQREEEVNSCIKVWRAAIKEYEPDNKKARIGDKNIGHIYMNIAAAKFVLQKYYQVYPLLDTVSNTKGQKLIADALRNLCNELEMRHDQDPTYAFGPDEDTQRLNYSLIFNLFMNYELTQKHQNLQVLMHYFPEYDHLPAKEINVNSENSGYLERINWKYDDERLTNVTYEVDREEGAFVRYQYDLAYDDYGLTGVDIAGTRKITFDYYDDGRLKTISRMRGDAAFQYKFEYSEEASRANIKLIVVQGESSRTSSSRYFVQWNDKMKLTDYNLDIYAGSGYTYDENGDLLTQTFNGMDDKINVSWTYERDENGKWVKMSHDPHAVFNRIVSY